MGGQHMVLTNSPHYRRIAAQISKLVCGDSNVQIQDLSGFDSVEEIGQLIEVSVLDYDPDVLVVDTFPRGLGGELLGLFPLMPNCKKVLISRTLPADYVQEYSLPGMVNEFYDLVISPGELSPFHKLTMHCPAEAFLLLDANEIPSRISAAAAISRNPERPLALVVASGNDFEIEHAIHITQVVQAQTDCDVLVATPAELQFESGVDADAIVANVGWPLMRVLPAVDLVAGWGGYNLFWETQTLGVPAILANGKRKYDDQTNRSNCPRLQPEQILSAISKMTPSLNRVVTPFPNGATVAKDLLLAL